MGWYSDIRDKVTGHDGTSVWKDAWDAGRGVFGFQSVPDATRPPLDPALSAFSESLALRPDNATISAMADRSGRFLRALNPAAQAAAKQRIRTKGFLGLAQIAPDYWSNLEKLALNAANTAEGIQTTSDWRAGLTGFLSGGGAEGLGSLGGAMFSGPAMNTQDLYLKGAKPGAFQGGFY